MKGEYFTPILLIKSPFLMKIPTFANFAEDLGKEKFRFNENSG